MTGVPDGSTGTTGESVVRDLLLDGRVSLVQPRSGFRVAIDTIFLAAALAPAPGTRLLEIGCGVGGASLCLLARLEREDLDGVSVIGLETQPDLVELANRNALENGRAQAFRAIKGDVSRPPIVLEPLSFDGVFFNPPYFRPQDQKSPENATRARATLEQDATLKDWFSAALRLLKPKGTLTLIHRAARLGDILGLLEGRAGAVVVKPLHPKASKPANRVIVSAVKDNRAPMTLQPGLVVHDPHDDFTPEADSVLRAGQKLGLK